MTPGRLLLLGAALVVACAACTTATGSTTSIAPAPSTAAPPGSSTTTDTAAPVSTTTEPGGTAATTAPETTTTATTTTTEPQAPLRGLDLELVAEGLHQPTVVTAPRLQQRLYVVERQGTIAIVGQDGDLLPSPFLDIRDRVSSNGIEQGLLGLAFHPDYGTNGRLFVYYVAKNGNRRLAEYLASGDRSVADPASERILIEREQPPDSSDIRHYAGNTVFGPDGYLYVSLGDGADFSHQGQDPNTIFASIIRIDVDGGDPYRIPPDNPFVDGGGAPEVWAYGLRNPWRFAIDPVERLLYVADVGQSTWEEINVVPLDQGGFNFGWPIMEGRHCFTDRDCDMTGLTPPLLEYDHEEGCSVTGGQVYHGLAIPELDGQYFYADWCNGWVRSFDFADGPAMTLRDWTADLAGLGQPNTFGLDATGEMYVANYEGQVFRIVAVR